MLNTDHVVFEQFPPNNSSRLFALSVFLFSCETYCKDSKLRSICEERPKRRVHSSPASSETPNIGAFTDFTCSAVLFMGALRTLEAPVGETLCMPDLMLLVMVYCAPNGIAIFKFSYLTSSYLTKGFNFDFRDQFQRLCIFRFSRIHYFCFTSRQKARDTNEVSIDCLIG